MPAKPRTDPRRKHVTQISLGLPEATVRDHQHAKFEVRGKSFAYATHESARAIIDCGRLAERVGHKLYHDLPLARN